jgi:23S rRNA G2445 N2-methylase RlmL
MYKGLAITNKGLESFASDEIKSLNRCKVEIRDNAVLFDSDFEGITRVCYRGQSINRVILLLSEFPVLQDMEKTLEKIEVKTWKTASFMVECLRVGDHDFRSVDIASEITKKIADEYRKSKVDIKVDYDSPKLIYYVFINEDKGYLGIDFSGFDLSKRQYKVFNHPEALKGVTGYAAAKSIDLSEKKVIVDPFMGSGIILIEAALSLLNYPVQFYNKSKLAFTDFEEFKDDFFKREDAKIKDIKTNLYGYDCQFRHFQSAQKNAKLAGIDKSINLSKVEIEWLDTKFEKKTVDIILTDPPRSGKDRDQAILKKVYKELFYQADYILKKNGVVLVLAKEYDLLEENAKMHSFKLLEKNTIYQGQEIFNLLKFIRGKT